MNWKAAFVLAGSGAAFSLIGPLRRRMRATRYTRGLRPSTSQRKREYCSKSNALKFGNARLERSAATQHFLFAGTSGSGKSLLQRHLLRDVLAGIDVGSDRRCLILDAKQDMVPFLLRAGVSCPVYSLNPLESRTDFPISVCWDVAADVTSPPRALNFVAGLFPEEAGGQNRYWTDAGRHVVAGVVESFIRHTPGQWSFSDFVFVNLNLKRIQSVLQRDEEGRDVWNAFLADDDTSLKVFTTIVSRVSYYRSVAALWQRCTKRLSIRKWLKSDSVLLLGTNATIAAALDPINELLFRVFVEEVDAQANSTSRETWAWIDEARLAKAMLRGERLAYFATKARSKGGVLCLSFQDIEGFRHACGSTQLADEIVAQCSYKMLARMESAESAKWAAGLVGQYETIEWFESESKNGLRASQGQSAQRVQKDSVLPAEFFSIPIPSKRFGATAVFLSPTFAGLDTVQGDELQRVVVSERDEIEHGIQARPEHAQILKRWTKDDERRLLLPSPELDPEPGRKLKLKRTAYELNTRVE